MSMKFSSWTHSGMLNNTGYLMIWQQSLHYLYRSESFIKPQITGTSSFVILAPLFSFLCASGSDLNFSKAKTCYTNSDAIWHFWRPKTTPQPCYLSKSSINSNNGSNPQSDSVLLSRRRSTCQLKGALVGNKPNYKLPQAPNSCPWPPTPMPMPFLQMGFTSRWLQKLVTSDCGRVNLSFL